MKKESRVGFDVDGVLANFMLGTIRRAKKLGLGDQYIKNWRDVKYWDTSPLFSTVMKDAWTDPEFWLTLPCMPKCQPLPVTPHCYITSRPVDAKVTEEWLVKNGFPKAKVISVSKPEEKLAHIKAEKIDVFIDDLYSTVRQLREAGINAILYKAPYQRGHKAECKGLPTIKTLDELRDYIQENVREKDYSGCAV